MDWIVCCIGFFISRLFDIVRCADERGRYMHTILRVAEKPNDGPFSVSGRMERWVDSILGRGYHKYCPGESWSPAINLYEASDHYSLVVDLAGMSAEKIGIRIEEDTLVLSGDRAVPGLLEHNQNIKLYMMEIDHGRFCRSLKLPEGADGNKIQARYRNGYLYIKISKKK